MVFARRCRRRHVFAGQSPSTTWSYEARSRPAGPKKNVGANSDPTQSRSNHRVGVPHLSHRVTPIEFAGRPYRPAPLVLAPISQHGQVLHAVQLEGRIPHCTLERPERGHAIHTASARSKPFPPLASEAVTRIIEPSNCPLSQAGDYRFRPTPVKSYAQLRFARRYHTSGTLVLQLYFYRADLPPFVHS